MTDAQTIFWRLRDVSEFVITADHLKLARRMHVGWDDIEFGAPAIDGKRPYGNSDVLEDIREIVGALSEDTYTDWDAESEYGEEMREDVESWLTRLHGEMGLVLQIALCTGQFREGIYRRSQRWSSDWKRLEDSHGN